MAPRLARRAKSRCEKAQPHPLPRIFPSSFCSVFCAAMAKAPSVRKTIMFFLRCKPRRLARELVTNLVSRHLVVSCYRVVSDL